MNARRVVGARGRVRAVRLAAAALLVVSLAGCVGDRRPQRPSGAALWIDALAQPLTGAQLSRLEAAGFGELFVDAARVTWEGGSAAVAPVELATVPRRTRVMLVARGEWPGAVSDAKSAARSLVAALEAVRRRAEGGNLLVAGWHLDLAGPLGKPQAELIDAVRDVLPRDILLAVSVSRAALRQETVRDALEPADLTVAFLYGVREGERDAKEAWDLRQVEAGVRRLEDLGRPYLVGAVVRGFAQHLRGDGEVEEVTGTSLADLAWNRNLGLQHGFSLAGLDRQVYEFAARAPTRVGTARLRSGDVVRIVGTSSAHVRELRRRIEATAGENHMGELYYRLAHPDEGFVLNVDNLLYAAADDEEPPAPRPQLTIETLSSSRGRLVVRLTLVNASAEPSDVGQVESNLVELRAVGGSFADVGLGDFYRYDLLSPDRRGQLVRTIRNPQILRLFAPVLASRARLRSGPIVLRVEGSELTDLQVRSMFLAPYGASAEVGPVSWVELAPKPTPTPSPAETAAGRNRS